MTGLTFGSLFSGIGGLDLGFTRAGMRCVWQVEIDSFCRHVLARHWPDAERFDNVFDVGKRNLRRVDVVVGGFPCQPVSAAGKQRGADDVRWLWPEFVRVVREIKPRWVVVENVVRLLSVNAGREFGGVVRDLAACGFCVEWDCLPAAAVGAPHIRDRVFVVAYAEQMGRGAGRGIASDERRTRVGRREFARGGQDLESATGRERVGWWTTESGLDRVAYGVSGRVDRLKGLGNAVVPQVAQWIGEHIVGANE